MKRFGNPKDLLDAMNSPIDDEASGYVTGVTIPFDGGFIASSGI